MRIFKQLDAILRGDATRMSMLRRGQIEIPVGGLLLAVILLGIGYGACVGAYAVIRTGGGLWMQLLASAVKLPLLFLLTLVVTFPSLYVFNALVGSRLTLASVLRLLMAMLGVMLAVLASLGPIVVFFAASTESYPFMKLLNVVMGTVAGVLGLSFLLRTLHRLVVVSEAEEMGRVQPWTAAEPAEEPSPAREQPATPHEAQDPEHTAPDADAQPSSAPGETAEQRADQLERRQPEVGEHAEPRGALDRVGRTSRRAKRVFQIWVVAFALVGAQMSWVLRPFIGDPTMPFSWFREREGNFFLTVIRAIQNLLGW